MGIIGKGANSFRKKDVAEQKTVALGFKKIRFAHKSTIGDTTINLASLVLPPEMSSNGFTNPSASAIAGAQIMTFRNNLKLVSSLRGLLVDQLSYNVNSNTTISFLGFTAEDGEIFQGWLDEAPTTSLQVVDGKTIVASGILLAGQTDFNIGTPIPLNQNPAQQIGAVMVFADRGLQYRKVGNITSGDGDYIEVPVAGGLGSLIRFNASGVDRFITVMSNGVVAERPDGSQTAFLERVQGQIDAMIPTLAAVAGVPETTFQTAPNDVDLKQFGDTVLGFQQELNTHASKINEIIFEHENPTYTSIFDTTTQVAVGGPVLGTWYQPNTVLRLNLQPGVYDIEASIVGYSAGVAPVIHVGLGTSTTPGVGILETKTSFAGGAAAITISHSASFIMSRVTFNSPVTLCFNIQSSAFFSGSTTVSAMGFYMSPTVVGPSGAYIKAWKISDIAELV